MSKNDLMKYKCPNCNVGATFIMDYCISCGYVDDNAPWIPSGTTCRNCGSHSTYSDPFDAVVACTDCGYAYWLDGSFEQIL